MGVGVEDGVGVGVGDGDGHRGGGREVCTYCIHIYI